jgi:prephenate dehydrogenase
MQLSQSSGNIPPISGLTLFGLGLMGGSLALATRAVWGADVPIRAIDPNAQTLQTALGQHWVNHVHLDWPDTATGWPCLGDNELVMLAAPLTANTACLERLAPLLAQHLSGIMVSDMGSCKRAIVATGEALLPAQFVGGHPMAGREKSGLQAATSLLFAGKNWYLTPTAQTPTGLTDRLSAVITALGAIPRVLDPTAHDATMAWVSHGPQVLSVLLAEAISRNRPAERLPLAGTGLHSMLRLAGSQYGLWHDVLAENADNLTIVLQTLRDLLDDLVSNKMEADKTGTQAPWSPLLEAYYAHANQLASKLP